MRFDRTSPNCWWYSCQGWITLTIFIQHDLFKKGKEFYVKTQKALLGNILTQKIIHNNLLCNIKGLILFVLLYHKGSFMVHCLDFEKTKTKNCFESFYTSFSRNCVIHWIVFLEIAVGRLYYTFFLYFFYCSGSIYHSTFFLNKVQSLAVF